MSLCLRQYCEPGRRKLFWVVFVLFRSKILLLSGGKLFLSRNVCGKNVVRGSVQYNFGPTHRHHFSYCDVIRPTKNTRNVYKKVVGRRTIQSTFKDYFYFLQIYCFCVYIMFIFLIFFGNCTQFLTLL